MEDNLDWQKKLKNASTLFPAVDKEKDAPKNRYAASQQPVSLHLPSRPSACSWPTTRWSHYWACATSNKARENRQLKGESLWKSAYQLYYSRLHINLFESYYMYTCGKEDKKPCLPEKSKQPDLVSSVGITENATAWQGRAEVGWCPGQILNSMTPAKFWYWGMWEIQTQQNYPPTPSPSAEVLRKKSFTSSEKKEKNCTSLGPRYSVADFEILAFLTHLPFFGKQKKPDKIWLFSVGKAWLCQTIVWAAYSAQISSDESPWPWPCSVQRIWQRFYCCPKNDRCIS